MNHQKSQALDAIDRNRELLCRVSDQLWEHPEVGFHEKYAAELYCDTLEALGFQVERNSHRVFRHLWKRRPGDRLSGGV